MVAAPLVANEAKRTIRNCDVWVYTHAYIYIHIYIYIYKHMHIYLDWNNHICVYIQTYAYTLGLEHLQQYQKYIQTYAYTLGLEHLQQYPINGHWQL